MKKRYLLAGLVVVASVAIGLLVAVRHADSDGQVVKEVNAQVRPVRRIAEAKPVRRSKLGSAKKSSVVRKSARKPLVEVEDVRLSAEDTQIADALQTASDDNDFKAVQKAVEAAVASRNPVLLKRAVEACRWFGEKALSELTAIAAVGHELAEKLMPTSSESSDRNDSAEGTEDISETVDAVIQESMDGIESALMEIESDAVKAKLVSQYMKTTSDEDMLTLLEGQLNTVLDEKLVVEAAVDIITTGSGSAVNHAKEVYKFQTGEDYTTPEAAQTWLSEKSAEAAASNETAEAE